MEKKEVYATGLILGILSTIFSIIFCIVGIVLGVIGIVLNSKHHKSNKIGAGLTLSIIGLVLSTGAYITLLVLHLVGVI